MPGSDQAPLSNKRAQLFHQDRRTWSDLMEEKMEMEVMSVDQACCWRSAQAAYAARR